MQKDFHYYCIAVLSRAAGFSTKDALTIAYASQYVDDATESEPLNLKTDNDLKFDPVRTAHYSLEAYNWSVQKRIYIPFHFLPTISFEPPGYTFTFFTESGSDFGKEVFDEACKENEGILRLCRIGIALHTFADTWAHQRFTGRRNEENDVENIYHLKDGKWHHLIMENILLDMLPKIGHLQAGVFPDQPFLTWKYSGKTNKDMIERNNTEIFLKAAKKIYDLLLEVKKSDSNEKIQWEEIEPEINELFKNPKQDDEKRCKKWRERFKNIFENSIFEYDRRQWRDDALIPKRKKDLDWDEFEPSEFKRLEFTMKPGFFNSHFYNFHKAALLQRHFVLERLP